MDIVAVNGIYSKMLFRMRRLLDAKFDNDFCSVCEHDFVFARMATQYKIYFCAVIDCGVAPQKNQSNNPIINVVDHAFVYSLVIAHLDSGLS